MYLYLDSIFKISTLNTDAKKFILKTSLVHYLFIFLISFANIFILLQAIAIVDQNQIPILLGLYLLVESIFALPAGSIGDSRSFRLVLSLSVFFYFITYQLVAISTNLGQFIFVYVLLGISIAFHLENFYSYFDNNYDYYAYEDTDRKIYSQFFGRSIAFKYLVVGLGIIVGSFISERFTRSFLFFYSSLLLLITLILTIVIVKDNKNYILKKNDDTDTFYSKMKNAFAFSWKQAKIRYFIIGTVISGITSVFWIEIFSVLLYAKIGKNDTFIGLLFFVEVVVNALHLALLGIIASKINRLKTWYLFSIFFAFSTDWVGLAIFLTIEPIPHQFNFIYFLLFCITYFLIEIPFNFNYILYYRTLLDMMPEEYRGSMYSLIAALKGIAGSIVIFLIGNYLLSIPFQNAFIIIASIGFIGSIISFFSLIHYEFKLTIKEPMGFFSAFMLNTKTGFKDFYRISNTKNIESYQPIINNIIKDLTTIAMLDYTITQEEKELIDVIITDIQAYFVLFTDLKSKNQLKISSNKEILKQQKENISRHAYANLNGEKTNEDLSRILEKLQMILKTI